MLSLVLVGLLACPSMPDDSGASPGCADYVGRIEAADLAASPRADADAERLALCLDGAAVASEATYVRTVVDLPVITALAPVTPTYGARYGDVYEHGLVVCTDDTATWAEVDAGTYTGWDCANAWYRGAVESLYGSITCAAVTFEPRLDPRFLVDEYAALPGMNYAEPGAVAGDGSTWKGVKDGETVHYVYDDRRGDCPSGCTFGTTYYIRSDGPGAAELVDSWSWGDTGASPEPEPAWRQDYDRCGG